MKRAELAHVLRAASDITRELEFLVVGSAAILGSFDDHRLPMEATRSREGDITPYRTQDTAIIDRIEIYLGEGSRFGETHGYFADAVELVTSKSPAGWERRLVRFSPPDANGAIGYCLEPHDCVAAKLGAGRDKDYEFAEALLASELVQRDTLLARVRTLPRDTGLLLASIRRAERWVEAYGKPSRPVPSVRYARVVFTVRPDTVSRRSHARARGELATLCGRLGGRTGTYALHRPPRLRSAPCFARPAGAPTWPAAHSCCTPTTLSWRRHHPRDAGDWPRTDRPSVGLDAQGPGPVDRTARAGSDTRMVPRSRPRRAGLAAALAALPVAAAFRFAHVYRVRAGYPLRNPPARTPGDLGLAWEDVEVPAADGAQLPGWFIPASDEPAPGVVLVHGWESSRDHTLPHAGVLHAVGFHVLAIDVRGHGANGPEALPVSVGEFAADTRAAVRWLQARAEVTRVAVLGHSMGAAGALVAAAGDPEVGAVVAVSTPAGPWRLTRQTFRLANLPIPGPVAWPLAWLTTRVYLRPRGHAIGDIDATRAVGQVAAAVLLVHGSEDRVVPPSHFARLVAARERARPGAATETLVVPGGGHSFLYEFPEYRAAIAGFLAAALGGPLAPEEAAPVARSVPATRLPEPERLATLDAQPGGLRSLALLVRRQRIPAESRGIPHGPQGGTAR